MNELELHKKIISSTNGFNFSESDINKYCIDPEVWKKFVRKKEAELVFSIFQELKFKKTIEFGAGEGFQTKIIADYSKDHICSYYSDDESDNHGNLLVDGSLSRVVYMQNDMQNLSEFNNETFDLIYTSNTLEHVLGIDEALSECFRILKKDGIMIHVMPNRTWKVVSFVLNTIRFRPPLHVHGTSNNHFSELYYFGRKPWIKKFQARGFKPIKNISMPFYTGTQDRFKTIIKLGNKYNLSSSFAYIFKKQ